MVIYVLGINQNYVGLIYLTQVYGWGVETLPEHFLRNHLQALRPLVHFLQLAVRDERSRDSVDGNSPCKWIEPLSTYHDGDRGEIFLRFCAKFGLQTKASLSARGRGKQSLANLMLKYFVKIILVEKKLYNKLSFLIGVCIF